MSCADVCLSSSYDGGNGFESSRVVKARTPHQCCECPKPINPGERYERFVGHNGTFFTRATCATCLEIRKTFSCGWFLFGELWELMREEMFPVWHEKGAWDCLAKLTTEEAVAACNHKFAEWLADGGDTG